MSPLEWIALGIVALYLLLRTREEKDLASFASSLSLLCLASWVAEESAIRLFDFYRYGSQWTMTLGHVPVAVVLIWPVIIHSAGDLASGFAGGRGWLMRAFGGGAIVLTDAMLIEPVAVKAGLWVWHEPGIFGVPPAGILGWGIFSFLSLLALDQIRGPWRYLTVPLIPALGTHLSLFLLWWCGLRWINIPVPTSVSVGGIWALSTLLVVFFLTGSPGRRVKRKILWRRVPGALFFFILLALNAESFSGLPAYALAFIPPYLALLKAGNGWEGSKASPPSEAPSGRCVDPTRGKGPVVQGESPWPKRQIPPLP
jgi:hypothetical protein